jgi:predicted permease
MNTLVRDLRFAFRQLRRKPSFTVITVLTLALGIGLNTAVFSAIDALLLRPLSGVREPDRLVQIYRRWPGIDFGSIAPIGRRDVQERTADVFTDVAVWAITPLSLSTGGRADIVVGQLVSANYFSILGVAPAKGRMFVASEDIGALAHPVVVVSYGTWQTRFGGDPAVIGRSVVVNGTAYTIVGVAPNDFKGTIPIVTPAFWVPLAQLDQIMPGNRGLLESRANSFMNAFARLKPGVSVATARARLTAAESQLIADLPNDYKGSQLVLVPQGEAGLHPSMVGAEVGLSAVIMAVVGLLLLIACVNVANLYLARASERWREMAVRVSIGARRSTLVRQLLTESLLVAGIAGAAGTGLAWWVIQLANHIQLPIDIPISADLRLSVPVLLFTLAITVLTGIAFGLVPALMSTRPSLVPALKGDAPAGASRSRTSRTLIVAQMALSIVLLVAAGLFLRSLKSATSVDKGFEADHLMLASFALELQGYSRDRAEAMVENVTARMLANPNVRAVGYSQSTPLTLNSSQRGVGIPGYTPRTDEQMSIDYNTVSAGYFDAMGIPMQRGHTFSARRDSGGAGEIVVNARFAQRFWPGQDAVGRTVQVGGRTLTVVGVVPTGKYQRLGEDPLAYMYLDQRQFWHGDFTMNLRTRGDPLSVAQFIRDEFTALDPNLPLTNVRTMNNILGTALLPARLAGATLGIFGLLGLVLASVGMYGVMSFSVAQRTREIGIRMALGARQDAVLGLVVRQGMTLVGVGIAIGLVGAFGVSRLLRTLLYGASATDPLTFIGVPVLLGVVALLAVLVPARRASTVDPVVALRGDG